MSSLLRIRYIATVLLVLASVLTLYVVITFSGVLARALFVGGHFAFFLPVYLWLDRRITQRLQRHILLPQMLTRLEASDAQSRSLQRAA